MLILKSGKREIVEGIEQPSKDNQNVRRKEKNLGILEVDTIKQAVMTEENRKDYFWRTSALIWY